ncbi:hypothetical protein VCRLGP8_1430115 [Vibrio crassostreae]|nr:hypothetical protein VCRLGP8_1430115 [Vibrio crassostreae]
MSSITYIYGADNAGIYQRLHIANRCFFNGMPYCLYAYCKPVRV